MNSRERVLARKIGHLMREQRRKCRLTQVQVASSLRISQSSLSKLEQGKLVPSVITWFDFCDKTKLTPNSVLRLLNR